MYTLWNSLKEQIKREEESSFKEIIEKLQNPE
jgi:hypothetical protein